VSRLGKPALFVDIDGVLAFQPEGLILAVNARFAATYLISDVTTYPFYDLLPARQQQWAQASRAVIAANLAPDTRAVRVVQKAAKAGLAVTICTERPPELAGLTRAWLAYWQVPGAASAQVVGPGGKEALLASYGQGNPALLVDDAPKNEALARPGVQVWVPPRPWTPQGDPPDGVIRFGDWRDVSKRLGLKK
jgi:uncharacterized HAD superfamily protein